MQLESYIAKSNSIPSEDWGLIDYNAALLKQERFVEDIREGRKKSTIIFCSHPPVVTLGRKSSEGDINGWSGETVSVSRGGRATYHGPNQIVCYPILDLDLYTGRDLHRLLRAMESAVVATLAEFGIRACGRTDEKDTGVWIGSRKIASLGIGVRHWISFHGLALNLDFDSKAFHGINPCGMNASTMISLEEVLGSRIGRAQVQASLLANLGATLQTT